MPWTRRAWKERCGQVATEDVAEHIASSSGNSRSVSKDSSETDVEMVEDEATATDTKTVAEEDATGELIWARIGGCPWWPGMTIDGYCIGLAESATRRWVFWFGDHRISKVAKGSCPGWKENFRSMFDPTVKKASYVKAITEACTLAAVRDGHACQTWSPADLCAWAAHGCPQPETPCTPQATFIPDWVYSTLSGYRRKNLLARKEMSSDDESVDAALPAVTQGKVSTLKEICIACRRPLKSLIEAVEHPLYSARVCPACQAILKENMYAQDPTYPDLFMYCSVCGNPGSRSLACKAGDCGRVFCAGCVDSLAGDGARRHITETRGWQCFVCVGPGNALSRLLRPHVDWQQHVMKFFAPATSATSVPPIPSRKTGIRVLSLFDGFGTGLVALTTLNISVSAYFASETDADSIGVVQHRHGDRVTALGDVRTITAADLAKIGPIDLLIGGSPCTELSIVNPQRKGIYDCRGSGALFFDFHRVLFTLRAANTGHLFWLFENVAAMDKETKETITRFLNCEPFLVDAKNFSPQNRARLFWGNLPGMDSTSQFIPKVPASLKAALVPGMGREPAPGLRSLRTVTTNSNSLRQGPDRQLPVLMHGKPDDVWITELEAVFGFPAHYTDLGNIGLRRRQRLLGRAWSVPVITRLLAPLTDFYLSNRSTQASNITEGMPSSQGREV